jgi:hypothetical protein
VTCVRDQGSKGGAAKRLRLREHWGRVTILLEALTFVAHITGRPGGGNEEWGDLAWPQLVRAVAVIAITTTRNGTVPDSTTLAESRS